MQSGCWAAWERAGPAITGNAGAIRRIAGQARFHVGNACNVVSCTTA